jgi:hypothetical protein
LRAPMLYMLCSWPVRDWTSALTNLSCCWNWEGLVLAATASALAYPVVCTRTSCYLPALHTLMRSWIWDIHASCSVAQAPTVSEFGITKWQQTSFLSPLMSLN